MPDSDAAIAAVAVAAATARDKPRRNYPRHIYRPTRYPAVVSTNVTHELKAEIATLAAAIGQAPSRVMREMLERAVPALRRRVDRDRDRDREADAS